MRPFTMTTSVEQMATAYVETIALIQRTRANNLARAALTTITDLQESFHKHLTGRQPTSMQSTIFGCN
jgi:hypothetical protein